MRVLLITNMYPPHHFGGYELSCRDVVDRFRSRGHSVEVLTSTFRKDGVDDTGTEPGVRRDLEFYWRDHQPWLPNGRTILAIERHDLRTLRAAVEATRPDVLSVWNMGALPLSLMTAIAKLGIPVVHHTCNDWPRLSLQLDPLRALLERRPILTRLACGLTGIPTRLPNVGASGTFCWVSKATWDAAEADTPWTFPRSTVVHSGISHVDFPPIEPPLTARPWGGRVLFVGRIDGLKGVETLIDAAPMLDPMRIDLVGSGDERYINRLLTRAAELGADERLTLTQVPREHLRSRYLEADVLVFPSTHEPFGLVPIEAMACGTPVIASGAGGSSEFLVDGENCVVYRAGDAGALAAAVRQVAADDALRRSLVHGGLRTAHEYSVDRLADKLEAAHLEAAASGV
jgi:glycosyltransferase involved in cell wall biosynthesis